MQAGQPYYRAIVKESIRLDLVKMLKGRVALKTLGFVPGADLHGVLVVLGDNVQDHPSAAVSNLLHDDSPMLERAICARGLTLKDCGSIQRLGRRRWSVLHHELAATMTRAVDADSDDKCWRIRVGSYAFTENQYRRSHCNCKSACEPKLRKTRDEHQNLAACNAPRFEPAHWRLWRRWRRGLGQHRHC